MDRHSFVASVQVGGA